MNFFPKHFFQNIITIPNIISLFRLLLGVPIFYLLDLLDVAFYKNILLIILIIAFISDFLDGYIARNKNLITEFGKIIDPLADKILVFIITLKLFLAGQLVPLYFWIIFLRDLTIFLGGLYVSKKIGKVLPSNLLGKITVLTIGIFLLLTILDVSKMFWLYRFFFYLSILLSLISVLAYTLRAYETIKWKKNEIIQ